MTSIPQPRISVGGILSQSMSVFVANLAPFLVLALILMVPSLIYGWAVVSDPTAGISTGALIAIIIQVVLTQLTVAAITYGSFQFLRGQPVGIGDALSRGLSLILPVLGVAILAGLAIGIGFILLVVPGIIVYVMLWVAIPAAVVERPGVVESLKRSVALTKGYRWQVFGVLLIIGVIFAVISFILQFVLVAIGGATLYSIGNWVLGAAYGAFSATAAAVCYYLLREAKEGIDINEIARVFD
jgi:hypothetical protein